MKFGLQDISLKISMCAKKGRETGSGIGRVLLGFPGDLAGKKSACSTGDLGSFPGLGRSPGEWKGYPLQYSGLEDCMDCMVHGVTKSRTRLSDFHFTSLLGCNQDKPQAICQEAQGILESIETA